LEGRLQPGSRVRVPLRQREVLGIVLELLPSTRARGVRPIAGLVGDAPEVTAPLFRLAHWIAEYYCCPVELALRTALPVVIRKAEMGHRERLFAESIGEVAPEVLDNLRRKSKNQADALSRLLDAGVALEVSSFPPPARSGLRALEKKGLARIRSERVLRDPDAGVEFIASLEHELTPAQQVALDAAVKAIDDPSANRPILLHGVTGSGKTEVYLRAIRHALEAGKTALVLVPEISLTPQTVERFKARFADSPYRVAVLHSRLTSGERHDEWHRVRSGEASIVVGARSAVFAPLERLGIIVVDEEHESSYKQEEVPRYHARDVAVMRAKLEGCAVLLGSATPSLESYQNTRSGKYHLVELAVRADDRNMPRTRVLDLRQMARRKGADSILTPPLCQAIEGRLARREQTILFLNRRGHSRAMICAACGHVPNCPNCSLSLTYHRDVEKLLCHLCGHSARAPSACPECRTPGIRFAGMGTQKVEESLRRLFPLARVERMDADTMSRRDAHRETLGRFRAGQIDILVGTQMIAKGLHFPNVTLVGIINADLGLHVPDFRAGERTFQLLTQVAGRAGRGETEGEVVVQTFTPFHPSIQFARHHDYAGFFEQEIEMRKVFGYPPFARMVLITIRSEHRERAEFTAQTLSRRLKLSAKEDMVVGEATVAPLEKAHGSYRFHVSLRGPSASALGSAVRGATAGLTAPEGVFISIDVDPCDLL